MIGRIKQRFTVADDGTGVVTDDGFFAEISGWEPGDYDIVVAPKIDIPRHEPDDPGGKRDPGDHQTQKRSDPRR